MQLKLQLRAHQQGRKLPFEQEPPIRPRSRGALGPATPWAQSSWEGCQRFLRFCVELIIFV